MHTSTLLSTVFSFSVATAAVLPRQAEARIQVALDNSDGASIVTATVGGLTVTKNPARRGVGAQLNTNNVWCVAFSDDEGTQVQQPIFDSNNPASYSSGEKIDLRSFFCADSRAAVEERVASSGGNGGNGGNVGGGAFEVEPDEVDITFELERDSGFRGLPFLVNGSPIPVIEPFDRPFSIALQGGNSDGVTCTAFGSFGYQIARITDDGEKVEVSDSIDNIVCTSS